MHKLAAVSANKKGTQRPRSCKAPAEQQHTGMAQACVARVTWIAHLSPSSEMPIPYQTVNGGNMHKEG